jgi:uncharacterized protein
MLTVTIYRDSRSRLSRIFAEGHTDSAKHGEDIVCASASAVLQSACLGLAEYARIPAKLHIEAGLLDLRWASEYRDRDDVQAIVETARLAIEHFGQQFPAFITVIQAWDPQH